MKEVDAMNRSGCFPVARFIGLRTRPPRAYLPARCHDDQADIFMPRDPRTQGHAPWVRNLLDNIEMRKLNIDRHVPLHGLVVPHSEFLQVVKDGYDRAVVREPPPYRYSPT